MPKPKWLEPLEQFGHAWIGFGTSLIFADVLWWRRERVKQWPPATEKRPALFIHCAELDLPSASSKFVKAFRQRGSLLDERYFSEMRVIDMMNDIHGYIIGSSLGSVVKCIAAGVAGYYIGKA